MSMLALDLTFKNGKSIEALLWTFSPESGFINALNEANGQVKRYNLKDIKSGVLYPTRERHAESGEDLLQKAINEGWDRS